MRTAPTRVRQQGSAALELMLAMPFILMFAMITLNFAQGFLSAQRGQRAARHLAWTESRIQDGVHPSGTRPDNVALKSLHYRNRGGDVTSAVEEERPRVFESVSGLSWLGTVADVVETVGEVLDEVTSWIGGADEGRIASLARFCTTTVDMTKGSVSHEVTGVYRLLVGYRDRSLDMRKNQSPWAPNKTMSTSHWVALRSWRASDPARRLGWWDPIAGLTDMVEGAFD